MTNAAPAAAGDAAAAAAAAPAQQATPSPADAAAAAAAAAAAPAGGAAAPADAAAPTPTSDAAQLAAKGLDTTGWPEAAITAAAKAQRDAARFQQEAGDSRIQSKQNAANEERQRLLAEFTKILDPDAAANAAPTLDGVTQQLGSVSAERDAAVRNAAAVTEAWTQGVDPSKLGYLQYQLSNDAAYKGLVATDAEFGSKLKASIAALVAADPTLKLTGSAVASGVESLGGAGGATTITPEAFASMSIVDRQNLYRTDKATYDKLVGNAS